MRKLHLLLLFIFIGSVAFSQILKPAKFEYTAIRKGKDIYELHIKAKLEPHWHIYSLYNPDGGAQATAIKINHATLVGKARENGKLISIKDNAFNVNQKFFENEVDFVQKIKVKNLKTVSGTLTYMVCNDHQCLPPKDVEFTVKL